MFDSLPQHVDVLIIGAGPSGTAMASSLADQGIQSLIVEREQFPRFAIGESLLPEAINCLDEVGLLDAVESAQFQYKDGALFATNEEKCAVNFADGFSPGRKYAYQVPRSEFDQRLADACISKGVLVSYQTSIVGITPVTRGYCLTLESHGELREVASKFLVDASGFGKVLAKKFNLDSPTNFSNKRALFCHFDANIRSSHFDRNKILIAQTYMDSPIWYWVIPFFGGHCSVGVVTDASEPVSTHGVEHDFLKYLSEQNLVSESVKGGTMLRDVGCISGYSSGISSLHGERYVILGNAGEFIDPIFSSGVTIALKSAVLASPLVLETIKQDTQPDWDGCFERPLREGVDTFKEYVLGWYAGVLPKLIYSPKKSENIYRMICGILAGYVWDRTNPMTRMTATMLKSLI